MWIEFSTAPTGRAADRAADQVRSGDQSQGRQGARPRHFTAVARARRQDDRIGMRLAAVHVPGMGTSRRVAEPCRQNRIDDAPYVRGQEPNGNIVIQKSELGGEPIETSSVKRKVGGIPITSA